MDGGWRRSKSYWWSGGIVAIRKARPDAARRPPNSSIRTLDGRRRHAGTDGDGTRPAAGGSQAPRARGRQHRGRQPQGAATGGAATQCGRRRGRLTHSTPRISNSRHTRGRRKNRRRPTLPGPCGPSTIGAEGLNGSVRKGKRCFPLAIATGNRSRRPPRGPSKLHSANARISNIRQALDPLVPVSYECYHSSRSGLSTWWSTRGLTPSMGMGELISRPASRLDAFSGYPIRT